MPPPDPLSKSVVNPPASIPPLEVVGQLSGFIDATPLQVDCGDGEIVVSLPNLSAALSLRRSMTRSTRVSRLRSLQAVLTRTGLCLRIVVGGHSVARLDAASRGGWLANLLGVAPLELNGGAVIRLVLGRPAPPDPRSSHTSPSSS